MRQIDSRVLIGLVLALVVAIKLAPAFVPMLLVTLVRYRKAAK